MQRRSFLTLLATGAASAQAPPPNVVIILCDDLGYADLGCYGNRTIQTPNLDRLAAQAVRFTDFHTTSPVCSPSRAALITGQYQQRYGIHHADVPESTRRYFLPASAITLAEVLKDAGYYTAHVGKWHLGEPEEAPHPLEQGFDSFFGIFGGRPSSGWIKYARSMNPEMIRDRQRPVVHQGHVTEVQTNAALEVIDDRAAKGPFFLNLWFNAPHEPLAPLPNQAESYPHWSKQEQTYFQTVTDIDRAVGRILQKLEDKGIARNTLVIFSSDNGPEAHSYEFSRGSAWPLKGMKTQLWEGGIRVPCLVRFPGTGPTGVVSPAVTSMLDVFPTVLAVTGTKPKRELDLDGGMDLRAAVANPARFASRPLFLEFRSPQRGVATSLSLAVRKGKWKLFADDRFERTELYDLSADIGETNNVLARNRPVADALLAELKRWKAGFNQPLPPAQRVETPSAEELEKRYYRN
ncbi:MAG: sulfatase-like hydrolase/transferase [Bryobacteraceae bacterium]|nr:sulfatase-like hydrolase/transferase [Bryobacteraceae bacterium]